MSEARARYFEHNGFGDGGYLDSWVKLDAGPLRIYFPNTAARVRAVKLHDLHHILTEYDTTWTGEAEIGAWEIAAGCGRHYPSWVLNLLAMAIGLALAPRQLLVAFCRGTHSRNLYSGELEDDMLSRTVTEMRRDLGLEMPTPTPSRSVVARFLVWSLVAVAVLVAVTAFHVLPIVALVRWLT